VNVQVLGPDKALWAASKPDQLVRVAPDGTLTQINFHGNDEFAPNSMVLGPDGNFWLTYQVGASCDLVRVTPAGDATRISDARFTGLHGIASGPDGNIWVADRSGLIFRVTPAGVVTAHSGFSGVWQIAFGADGKLYYTSGSRIIGAFDTARGTHVQYQIPNLSGLGQLVRASDGNIWFSGNIHERAVLGWLAPSGESRVFALPASASPSGLAVGADGHVWFGDTKFGLRWITRDGHVGGYPLAWIDDGVSTISVAADGSFWIAVIGNTHADPAFIHVDF
jgi:streptogramin lyase